MVHWDPCKSCNANVTFVQAQKLPCAHGPSRAASSMLPYVREANERTTGWISSKIEFAVAHLGAPLGGAFRVLGTTALYEILHLP